MYAQAVHQFDGLAGHVMPVVIVIPAIGAAVTLHVGNDEAVTVIDTGQNVMPGIPAFGQSMKEKDDGAVRLTFLYIVRADAVDGLLIVMELSIHSIVSRLSLSAKLRPRASRRRVRMGA